MNLNACEKLDLFFQKVFFIDFCGKLFCDLAFRAAIQRNHTNHCRNNAFPCPNAAKTMSREVRRHINKAMCQYSTAPFSKQRLYNNAIGFRTRDNAYRHAYVWCYFEVRLVPAIHRQTIMMPSRLRENWPSCGFWCC